MADVYHDWVLRLRTTAAAQRAEARAQLQERIADLRRQLLDLAQPEGIEAEVAELRRRVAETTERCAALTEEVERLARDRLATRLAECEALLATSASAAAAALVQEAARAMPGFDLSRRSPAELEQELQQRDVREACRRGLQQLFERAVGEGEAARGELDRTDSLAAESAELRKQCDELKDRLRRDHAVSDEVLEAFAGLSAAEAERLKADYSRLLSDARIEARWDLAVDALEPLRTGRGDRE